MSFGLTPICSYVLFSFSIHNTGRAMRTGGQVLADAVSFALIRARKIVRGLKQGLTDQDRRAVADDAVRELKKYGDPWRLNEDWTPLTHEGYCPPDWSKPKPEKDFTSES